MGKKSKAAEIDEGVDPLIKQMHADVEEARRICADFTEAAGGRQVEAGPISSDSASAVRSGRFRGRAVRCVREHSRMATQSIDAREARAMPVLCEHVVRVHRRTVLA